MQLAQSAVLVMRLYARNIFFFVNNISRGKLWIVFNLINGNAADAEKLYVKKNIIIQH